MHFNTEKISDQIIISMISENNNQAWGHLYDKYAPAMYGIICSLTEDKKISDEIFIKTFLQLKEQQILSKVSYSLCSSLLRHTHISARQQLKNKGITPTIGQIEKTSFIDTICAQNNSIKELASKFNSTEEEIKKRLRTEFLGLRSKQIDTPQEHWGQDKQYAII